MGILDLLGSLHDPAYQRVAGNLTTAIDFIGAPAFVAKLPDEKRDALMAATLGVDPDDLSYIGDYLAKHVHADVRRDATREKEWQIEADLVARFSEQIAVEIERATQTNARGQSEATKKTYADDQRHFAAFCRGLDVPSLPASPPVLATYILDHCKPSVLRRRLAAIADWHRQHGRVMPKRHPLVRFAMKQATKAAEAQQSADPSPTAGQNEESNGKS
jgi:hypothetical protein